MRGPSRTASEREQWFTRTTRTALLEALRTLGPGPGRNDIIPWALTAQSDAQARFMAGAVVILAAYQRTEEPLAKLRVAGTLVGQTSSGGLVVPAPEDYVAWTERVAKFATRPDLATRNRQIWLTGRLSPRAREELAQLKWSARENVQSILGPGGPAALEGTATNPKSSPDGSRGDRSSRRARVNSFRLQDWERGMGSRALADWWTGDER